MTGPDASWSSHEEASMRHAWDWFSLHAAQRLQMYNFFCITTAFLVAAFVNAHGDRAHPLAAFIGVAGAASSVAFNLLERRTRELVHAAEAALRELEARLAKSTGVPAIGMVEAVERPTDRLTKYSFVFNLVQRGTAVAWAVGSLVEGIRYT